MWGAGHGDEGLLSQNALLGGLQGHEGGGEECLLPQVLAVEAVLLLPSRFPCPTALLAGTYLCRFFSNMSLSLKSCSCFLELTKKGKFLNFCVCEP